MAQKYRTIATSLVLIVFATARSANAADLCFQYGSGGGIVVAKGATLPKANTCQSLAMYEVGAGGREGAATGSICQDWAGATVIFHYTYDACIGHPGSYFESATCRLQLNNGNLPTTSSSCRGKVNNGDFADSTLKLWSCDADNDVSLRVPNDTPALCSIRAGFSHRLDDRMMREKEESDSRSDE
jgi:hypothetical protein